MDVSSGARFRPPVIMSSGPSLLIRFYANGGTGLGYKAFYSFVIGHPLDKSVQPITDCGGYVENLGGTITMLDMVGEGVKTYDCVWLIRPPKNFLHMKTHMYLKVITFADMGKRRRVIFVFPSSSIARRRSVYVVEDKIQARQDGSRINAYYSVFCFPLSRRVRNGVCGRMLEDTRDSV